MNNYAILYHRYLTVDRQLEEHKRNVARLERELKKLKELLDDLPSDKELKQIAELL
jgi:cell division protein FtsB